MRELGEGGFGAVYLAHDTVANIDVAIKGLPPEVKHNAVELESIQQNFALVKRLRHPNIVAVTDLHQALSVSYASKEVESKLRVFERDTMVVMDYAPGMTLSQWRKRFDGGTVPLDSAIAVVRQVASALDFAHARKVLHRDVKPANVIVEEVPAGGGLTARVLDFGLAAEIRSSMGRVSREIRDTSGTRPYMAPEQWLGEKQGPATDQYSLAVLFFELVTGAVPFASVFDCGDTAVMRLAVTTDAPKIPADLPKKVRLALATALAKKPEERFASCGEFVDALEGNSVASSGGAGKVLGILALLAALAGGGYYGWMKYGKGAESPDAVPGRVAATNQPPQVIVQPPSEEPPKPPSGVATTGVTLPVSGGHAPVQSSEDAASQSTGHDVNMHLGPRELSDETDSSTAIATSNEIVNTSDPQSGVLRCSETNEFIRAMRKADEAKESAALAKKNAENQLAAVIWDERITDSWFAATSKFETAREEYDRKEYNKAAADYWNAEAQFDKIVEKSNVGDGK